MKIKNIQQPAGGCSLSECYFLTAIKQQKKKALVAGPGKTGVALRDLEPEKTTEASAAVREL